MLRELELTFLKNESEKVFSDKSALLETQVVADNKHTQNRGSQKQHLGFFCSVSVMQCFDLV